MIKQVSIIVIIGLTALLSGCTAEIGNAKLAKTSNETIRTAFIKGKTTKQDVKKVLGEPSDIEIMTDRQEKWIYTSIKRTKDIKLIPVMNLLPSSTTDTTRTLVMVFIDEILEDYSVSVTQKKSK